MQKRLKPIVLLGTATGGDGLITEVLSPVEIEQEVNYAILCYRR
jgi:hypothetical protein